MRAVASWALRAALGLSILGASASANATIYDISASNSAGTPITLTANQTYLIKWVGIADGGLYDAANVQLFCNTGCTTGFSNAFVSRDDPFDPNDFELDIFSTNQLYSTAASSLAAYQAGNNISHSTVDIFNGSPVNAHNLGFIPNPFIFTADGGSSRLFVLDTDGTLTNNSGGISLSIEEYAPVPEPASWAMMLTGFGLAGSALRRTRRKTVSAPAM